MNYQGKPAFARKPTTRKTNAQKIPLPGKNKFEEKIHLDINSNQEKRTHI